MIAFDLQCKNGHTFEGWFEDAAAYDDQKARGFISCPVCDDTEVVKIPSKFAIKGPSQMPMSVKPDADMEIIGRQIAEYVERNFDNVGSDFAEEALKIHYGVSEQRNIRGVSTKQEEETLKQEGIQFFKLPVPAAPDTDTDN
ncbi:MAG: DUF1178 family protein [Desulfobacteraceae bacterium]|nr:DUF1178 family protein [Desulfobacteraceae bacterium]